MATVASKLVPRTSTQVAIFAFPERGIGPTLLGEYVADKLMVAFGSSPNVSLVERGRLDTVREEQRLGVSGEVNDDTAASIGSMAGAEAVVVGTLTNLGESWELNARLLGASDVRIRATAEAAFTAQSIPPGLAGKAIRGSQSDDSNAGRGAAEAGAVFAEDFRQVDQGLLPDGWTADDGVGVVGSGPQKCLGELKKTRHKIRTPEIELPEDFRIELDLASEVSEVEFKIGNVSAGFGHYNHTYHTVPVRLTNSSKQVLDASGLREKRVVYMLEKKGQVFRLLADGKQLTLSRFAEYDGGTAPIIIETDSRFCLYNIAVK